MYMCVFVLSIKTGRNRFFSAGQSRQIESDLNFSHLKVKVTMEKLENY